MLSFSLTFPYFFFAPKRIPFLLVSSEGPLWRIWINVHFCRSERTWATNSKNLVLSLCLTHDFTRFLSKFLVDLCKCPLYAYYSCLVCSDYLFKLLLIGDSAVGKSCLLLRFAVSCPSNLTSLSLFVLHTDTSTSTYRYLYIYICVASLFHLFSLFFSFVFSSFCPWTMFGAWSSRGELTQKNEKDWKSKWREGS